MEGIDTVLWEMLKGWWMLDVGTFVNQKTKNVLNGSVLEKNIV
jgi:hypothetical protein